MNRKPRALPRRGRASLLLKGVYGGKWEQEDSAKPAGVSLGFVLLKARQTGLLTPQHHHSSRAQHCKFAQSELCAILDLVSALLCLMSVTGGQHWSAPVLNGKEGFQQGGVLQQVCR